MPDTQPAPAIPLETVKQQFKTWRETRKHKCRIPAELWEAAAGLSDQYSVHHISRALRVNHTALKERIAARKIRENAETGACFLELSPLPSSSVSQCLIEMENSHGEKMRMHFTGEVCLDLLALSQDFWTTES